MKVFPAIFRNIHGKVDAEVENVLNLLFRGVNDNALAISALNTKHNSLSQQVTQVSSTATSASKTASSVQMAIQQPVTAGQTRQINAADATQQSDHLGLVQFTGTTAYGLTLNNLVAAPFTTRLWNNSTQNQTLTPSSGTVNGSATFTLTAGATVHAYFDGYNWTVA